MPILWRKSLPKRKKEGRTGQRQYRQMQLHSIQQAARRVTMTVEDNKLLVRRLFEEVWSQGNLELAQEIIHERYQLTNAGAPSTRRYGLGGPEDLTHEVISYRNAFPDLQITL